MDFKTNSSITPETRKMEMRRLILQSIECGIKKESIGFSIHKFKEILDENFHNGSVTSISDKIYRAGQSWSRSGVCILVDGGDENLRETFGGACLFRFLVTNTFIPNGLVENVRMSELITNLSTFDQSRFELAKRMSDIPCLLIQEVDLREHPRDTNDCIMLLDSIFFHRIRHNRPTIITLSQTHEDFGTPAVFGKIFGNIITSKNENEIWNIRLVAK